MQLIFFNKGCLLSEGLRTDASPAKDSFYKAQSIQVSGAAVCLAEKSGKKGRFPEELSTPKRVKYLTLI